MKGYLSLLLLGCTGLAALVVLLAARPRSASRLAVAAGILAALGGTLLYGYGYLALGHKLPLAIVETLFCVCRMFIGEVDFESVMDAQLYRSSTLITILFWAVHLLAFFTTVTAAVSAIGTRALRRLRVRFAKWHPLNIIFGVNSDSVAFAKELLLNRKGLVVFVDAVPGLPEPEDVTAAGGVFRSDLHAEQADRKFLRSVGICRGGRKIHLYAFEKDANENLRFARDFLDALQNRNIRPDRTSLVIQSGSDSAAHLLQVNGDHYGFGSVHVFQEAGLAARLLVQLCPPCETVTFDETGSANDDFEAVIVGFGQLGQAVLKQLVMNSQFPGSTFRAAVFSPDCQNVNGYFSSGLKQIVSHYDISFHPYDARSAQMYDYLAQRGKRVKYAAICTGSPRMNQEIADELTSYFRDHGIYVPVHQCSYQGIRVYDSDLTYTAFYPLYDPEILSLQKLDSMAMVINHYYTGNTDLSPRETWMHCDYFSRTSCRASADAMPAMLRAAGKNAQQVLEEGWALTPEQLENLSIMEHKRWCAFHFCMGFAAMTAEEFETRAAEYRRQKEEGTPTIRVAKNMTGRTHACLVDWNDLDELSRRELELTGRAVNYKELDADNVRIIPTLLKSREELD